MNSLLQIPRLSTPTFVLSAQLPTMGIGAVSDDRLSVTPNAVLESCLIPVPAEAFNVGPIVGGPHLEHAPQAHRVLAYQCHVPFSFHTYTLPRFNSKSMRHQVNAQRYPVNLTPPLFLKKFLAPNMLGWRGEVFLILPIK